MAQCSDGASIDEARYFNSLLFAGGNVGHRCMQILLDSGAALSVIRNDALDNKCRKSLIATSKTAIGANGLPLKVMGKCFSGKVSSSSYVYSC